jgi:ankyrin repeat protein
VYVEVEKKGYLRLMMHCCWGRDSGVYRMLRLKANVHAEDEDGWTALTLASWKGRKDAVRALLKAASKVKHVT